MESLLVFTPPPSTCGYLPHETWQLTYEIVGEFSATEYMQRMKAGWRRFGHSLFKPQCPTCRKCQSVRVPVATFKPDRSQRRAAAANDGEVTLRIGTPE